jgi:hypothetical protein
MSGAIVVGDGGLERLDIAPVASVRAGGRDIESPENATRAGFIGIVGGIAAAVLLGVAILSRRKGDPAGT